MTTNSDFLQASAVSLEHAQGVRSRRRRNRRVLGLLLLLLLLIPSIGSTYLTMALFIDQETVDADFTAGTIALDAGKIDALALTVANLMPGDQITDDVVVENDGNAELRYAVSTSSTGAGPFLLRDVLVLTIKTVDATLPATPCDNFDGTQLFTGVLGAGSAVVGLPAQGSDLGDRTLLGATNETLCFRVALPAGTGNSYQGLTTTTTFTFDAEQTTAN
jgi:Camelysin metallo-endopeptidase